MAEYELWHYGVKGMKWGVRRFQKKDGTLTSAGKKRYQGSRGDIEKVYKNYNENDDWGKIYSEVLKKSGDWYSGEGVSKGFKDTSDWYKKARKKMREEQEKYRSKAEIDADKAREVIKTLDASKDPYWKKLETYRKNMDIINKSYRAYREDAETRAALDKRYELERELKNELSARLASVVLRDLGYNDTKAGRKFLIDNNLLSSDVW